MNAQRVTHGPYDLVVNILRGDLMIRRRDPDRLRTVAFINTMDEWDRFVAAVDAGADEVAAVHAIDVDPRAPQGEDGRG